MLRMDNSNVNFNGSSSIDEVVIANMNANYIGDSTNIYFSFNINDIAAYMANAEAVDADFAEFKAAVLDTISTML